MGSDFVVLVEEEELYIDLTPHKTKWRGLVRSEEEFDVEGFDKLTVEKDFEGRIVGISVR